MPSLFCILRAYPFVTHDAKASSGELLCRTAWLLHDFTGVAQPRSAYPCRGGRVLFLFLVAGALPGTTSSLDRASSADLRA
jgi:hypothetical protein